MLNLIKRETALYWLFYLLFAVLGYTAMLEGVLVVQSPAVFLLSLLWAWTGVAAILKLEPPLLRVPAPGIRLICALLYIALGLVWAALSFTGLAGQAALLVGVTVPFAVVLAILMVRGRKTGDAPGE